MGRAPFPGYAPGQPFPGAPGGAGGPAADAPRAEKTGGGLADLLKSPLSALGDFLDLDDREFWKGALVGVAAVLLLGGQGMRPEESPADSSQDQAS